MKTIINDFINLFHKEPLIIFILCWLLISNSTIATYATLILIPYLAFKKAHKYIDSLFLIILCYSISYALFTYLNGWYSDAKGNIVFQSLYPPLFYLLGKLLIDKYTQYKYMIFILIISLMGFYVFIDVINDIRMNQFINPLRLIESGDSATYLGLNISLCVSSIGCLFSSIQNKKEIIYKFTLIAISFLALICIIHLINRTGIVLAIISILCTFILNIKNLKTTNIFIIIIILVISILIILKYVDTYEIINSYIRRNTSEDSSAYSFGGRLNLWISVLEDIVNYPVGVYKSNKMIYAHNYWLDTARTSGIVPFIILLILSIIHIKYSIKVIRKHSTGLLKTLLIICNIGFFLTFFVEPAMEACMNYVFVFYMFMGITRQLYINRNYKYN